MKKINAELDAVRDQITDATHVKPEILEERIRKTEEKIEYESHTIVEKKNLQKQVAQWKVCLYIIDWILKEILKEFSIIS